MTAIGANAAHAAAGDDAAIGANAAHAATGDDATVNPRRHAGRVVIVTGAASGIGRATVARLVAEGAQVVACDVDGERLDETLVALRDDDGVARGVVGDLTDAAHVERLVREAIAAFGRVDALANVAGVGDWLLPAHVLDDATWRRVLAVNVTAPMLLCRAVLPSMMERGGGRIVNVASAGALRGGAAGCASTVSKHALTGLTRSVAWTYRREGIRCNALCPGAVETNIVATSTPRSNWGFEQLAPVYSLLHGMAHPDEIAGPLSWLLSDESAQLNGAIVTADSGWSVG